MKSFSHEFCSLQQLLKWDLSATDPAIFKSRDQYNEWKFGELQSMDEQIKAMIGQSKTDVTAFVSLSIKEGKDIKSKSKENEHHTYVKVFYDGQIYTSPIFRDSLEPKWNFETVLAIRNPDAPILITTWLHTDQKQEGDGHNFLGLVVISGNTLLEKCSSTPFNSWIPLGKRSARSHVSGQILIQGEILQLSRENIKTRSLFQWIPSDSEQVYFHILRRCLVQDLDLLQTGHETEAFDLLATLSKKWRVSSDYHTGV